jgi:hypothetical protein
MKADGKIFVEGKRFRLSELGEKRCPKFIVKVGTIVTVRKNTASITVKFDGNKQTTALHRTYIEPT